MDDGHARPSRGARGQVGAAVTVEVRAGQAGAERHVAASNGFGAGRRGSGPPGRWRAARAGPATTTAPLRRRPATGGRVQHAEGETPGGRRRRSRRAPRCRAPTAGEPRPLGPSRRAPRSRRPPPPERRRRRPRPPRRRRRRRPVSSTTAVACVGTRSTVTVRASSAAGTGSAAARRQNGPSSATASSSSACEASRGLRAIEAASRAAIRPTCTAAPERPAQGRSAAAAAG